MKEMKRVVVTGMGAITPIGNNVDEFWKSIKEEKVGFAPITYFDATEYKTSLAAEVKDFVAKDYMDPRTARRMALFSQYAVAATGEAIKDANLDLEKEDTAKIGVSVGSGIGSLQVVESTNETINTKGPKRVKPMVVPMMISNMAAGNVSLYYGLRGKSINVVTACATGTQSIGEAYRSIQCGEADVMIAGGTEAAITPVAVGGFAALTALSESEDPKRASIPFDKERDGFIIGEGAGVVVLETLEHAKERGANILAEIVGYGATSDAFHITSPAEDGEGAARAMEFAMNEAEIKPEDVDYINAHGTSTHANDAFETLAIKKALKDAAYDVKISSTKSMIGHGLGAAGAVEFITCVKTIQEDYIHPNVGLKVKDEECDLNCITEAVEGSNVNYVLSNSLGFGGHNATLLVKKYEG